MATLKNTIINNTSAIQLPVGTTAQRPGSPANGYMRFNSTLNVTEYYSNGSWLYLPNVVRDGLVLYLDAAEPASYPGSGTTWTDLSGNSNNGTLTNGPTFSSSDGGSIVFDGVNDYVIVAHSTNLNPSLSMTVSAWVKVSNFVTNMAIFGKGTTTSGQGGFGFNIASSTQLNLVKYFIIDQTITLSTSLSLNTWYHISAVQSSSSVTYFVNGQSVGVFSNSTSYQTNTAELRIARNRGTLYSPIFISNVYFYNRQLTVSEIIQNFNATKGRYGL